MKKMMMLLAFCGFASAAMAQTEQYPTLKRKVVTNGFWDNWFIDAGVTHVASYSGQEHGLGLKKNPFWTGRRNWGAELSVGKWATPVFGMRLKGGFNWFTQVNGEAGWMNPTYKAYTLNFEPMVNLTNLFGGYKPRCWEFSVYGGAGILHHTTDNSMAAILVAGAMNTWNITKRFHLNLDVYGRVGERDMDGIKYFTKDGNRISRRDLHLGFSAGVGVNLGKVGWDNAPDMDAILANHKNQLAALGGTIAGLEAENADLKNKLANAPKGGTQTKVVTEFASTAVSVFFNLNQSVFASKKDLIDVKLMAEYAKANNKTLVVAGYADSKTGSPAYNQKLSERRAQAVVEELVKYGVDRNKIEVVGQGGVADLNPYTYNRRAVVTMK